MTLSQAHWRPGDAVPSLIQAVEYFWPELRHLHSDAIGAFALEAYSKTGRRMRITPERVTEILQQLGVSADTVKHRIRADLASKKMLGSVP
jgi:hypothetical protein